MIVSTYERKLVEEWTRHVGIEQAREMIHDLRREMPTNRFGLVENPVVVNLPRWASDARRGIMRPRTVTINDVKEVA